jgi:hypothetical protein
MIKAFPKIFAIGTDYISDIFNEEVEITEKIDGSQFDFGKVDGKLYYRSKGKIMYPESVEKMFRIATDYVHSIEGRIPNNVVYYCEYLMRPKHNTLTYERVPKNNLILFGISNLAQKFNPRYIDLEYSASLLDIEAVPLVYRGKINKADEIFDLIKNESVLGGTNMEGIVVKNYDRPFLLGGQPIPVMAGKYVSEKFKEVHQKSWGREKTHKGKFEVFKEGFRTEARWSKAVQHLREDSDLENSPRDIGKLIKEVQRDIYEEEIDNIKNFLFKEFGSEIMRHATRGLPEWYKEQLVKSNFQE